MKGLSATLCALALTMAACGGSDSEAESSATTDPDTAPTETIGTEPEPVPMLSEVLGFIEISVRIGVGQSAEVVALEVDSELLSKIELNEPSASPAWCSGSFGDLVDLDSAEEYRIVIRDQAVDITLGGAERFELGASDVVLGAATTSANILLISDGVRFEVPGGEIDFGESFISGTFRGTATNGVEIEGAFLCG